jgi:hypothetical protein
MSILLLYLYQKFLSSTSSQDGRVGLRRQFQVLVRNGMGSNPILDKYFDFFKKSFRKSRCSLVNCLCNKEGVEAELVTTSQHARLSVSSPRWRFRTEQWAA